MRVSCVLLAWVASYPTTPLPVLHVVIGFLPGSGLPFTSVVPKYTFIYFIYLAYRLRKLICFCKHRTNILGPQNSELMYNPPPPRPSLRSREKHKGQNKSFPARARCIGKVYVQKDVGSIPLRFYSFFKG